MDDDRLRELVAASAGRPEGEAPMSRIVALAARRRTRRRLTAAAVPLAALVVAGVVALTALPQARVELAPADPAPDEEAEAEPGEPATPPEQPAPSPEATSPPPEEDPEPEATVTPTEPAEDDPPGPAPPEAVLVTDGRTVELREAVGGAPAWSLEAAGEGERVLALAVRPGSTADDLDAVVALAGEDGFALAWLTVVGGEPELRRDVEGAAAVSPDAAPGSEPWPVWSPDGDVLAWVELPADETAAGVRLRVAAWDEQARVGVDDGAVTLDDLPLQVIRAETLTEAFEPDVDGERELYLSSWTLEAWRLRLLRGPDGWELSMPVTLLDAEAVPWGAPVAIGRDDHPGAAYFLLAVDADADGVALELFDASGHQGLPLDDEVRAAPPADVWVAGGGHHVLVGDGRRAWITSRPEGLRRPLEGEVVHADWVR